MHVPPRALAAVAASALLASLVSAAPALAAPGDTAPPAARSVSEYCAAVPAGSRPFTDAGTTFDREIACLAALRVARGGPEGLREDRFGPELPVRRDAMATFLVRLADRAAASASSDVLRALPATGPARFRDVPEGGTHTASIRRLAAAGIVEGGPGGRPADQYGPALTVTRAQMASFVVRTLEHVTARDLSVPADYFVDDERVAVHEPRINALAAAAVGVGDGASRFSPDAVVRRGQMAGFLTRALAFLQAEGYVAPLDPVVPVQLLGINDFHGRLDPPPADAAVQTSVAGRLSGVVNRFRAEVPSTHFVSAGDSIGASPFLSAVAKDAPTLEVLNAMRLDASAVGNHEFDRGFADLAGRVQDLAEFPYLAANVEGDVPDLPGSAVVETADGLRIGYIGVVTAETAALVSPEGIRGITFADPVAAINREAALLTDRDPANGEADVVVVLAHEGAARAAATAEECAAMADADDAFGRIVRGSSSTVDAIFGGHTHVRVDCEVPNPGGRGEVRPVLEAAEYGTALARLTFSHDSVSGAVSKVDGRVVTLNEAGFPGVTHPVVEAIVDRAEAQAKELGSPVIGTITQDIRRATTSSGAEDRGSESVLGNFVADVQLEGANRHAASQGQAPVQIAFMNPGGLRADFRRADIYDDEQVGEVTFGEAGVVQPFGNTLFTMSLTGAQVDQLLEQQVQPSGSSRPFLALGVSKGFFFRYDPAAAAGARISEITLDGTPIDPAASYRVVVNSFLAGGGDNFTVLRSGTTRIDTGLDDLTVLVEHFRRNTPITADTTPRRQIG
jgi:2',3'-cyclic-nucleotide 2'-phosphodiesterase (5'-nucleotidase family)